MGSLKNIENSCHPFSEVDNENRCLIIRQSKTRNALKKKKHDDELLDIEVIESKGILKEQMHMQDILQIIKKMSLLRGYKKELTFSMK